MRRSAPWLLLAACHSVTPGAPTDTDLPEVPADLGVGVVATTFIDSTRGTPANGAVPAADTRTLPVRIWYPAAVDPTLTELEDAPLDTTLPWPVIVFVHGSSATPLAYAWAGQALARRGYVVVAADFLLTSLFTDGGPTDWHVEDQPADVSFLVDRVASGDVPLLPSDALDLTHGFVVAGHSTGGTVALLSAYMPDAHDDRVAGAIDLSGDACFFGDSFFSTRPVPLLAIGGTDDLYVPAPNNVVRAWSLATEPKTLALIVGGTHLGFTNAPLNDDPNVTPTRPGDPLADTLAAYGGGTACEPVPARADDPTIPAADQHALTAAWMAAFADETLRLDAQALDALKVAADPRVLVDEDAER